MRPLSESMRTATLPEDDLARARRRQAELKRDEPTESPLDREIDADPHYRGWQWAIELHWSWGGVTGARTIHLRTLL